MKTIRLHQISSPDHGVETTFSAEALGPEQEWRTAPEEGPLGDSRASPRKVEHSHSRISWPTSKETLECVHQDTRTFLVVLLLVGKKKLGNNQMSTHCRMHRHIKVCFLHTMRYYLVVKGWTTTPHLLWNLKIHNVEQKKQVEGEWRHLQNGRQHEILFCLGLHFNAGNRIINSKLRRMGRKEGTVEASFTGSGPGLADFIGSPWGLVAGYLLYCYSLNLSTYLHALSYVRNTSQGDKSKRF